MPRNNDFHFLFMYLCAWKMPLDTYHESGDQGKRRGVLVLVQ